MAQENVNEWHAHFITRIPHHEDNNIIKQRKFLRKGISLKQDLSLTQKFSYTNNQIEASWPLLVMEGGEKMHVCKMWISSLGGGEILSDIFTYAFLYLK